MGKRKTIFYLIDGARPDTLEKLSKQGILPNITELLINQGSFTKGTTCFPSTTGPAYLPFLTGYFPGDHDITGIRWFDKDQYFKGRWSRNSMRSYCGYEAKYFNDDMHSDKPSLFEIYERGFNIYNMVTKGVKEEFDVTKEGKTGLYFNAHFKHIHHLVDEKGHEKLMSSLDKDPEFIFAVFPSIDWDSHTYHFEDDKTIEAYKIVDRSLGEVTNKLREDGTFDDTLIVMASDHGLSSTHSHLDLGKFFRKSGYRVLEYPTIWTMFPKVAIFISGNSFATATFLDKKELYYKDELYDKHKEVLSKLVKEAAIDFIIVRKDEVTLSIINDTGEAQIKSDESGLSYKPLTADPLKTGESPENMSKKEAFDFCFNSEYPDALVQCQQLFNSKRTGDVVISAATGYDLRDFWEIPEHKGSHGSLHWEHMYVPILTNKKDLLTENVRTTEVFGLINSWMKEEI